MPVIQYSASSTTIGKMEGTDLVMHHESPVMTKVFKQLSSLNLIKRQMCETDLLTNAALNFSNTSFNSNWWCGNEGENCLTSKEYAFFILLKKKIKKQD